MDLRKLVSNVPFLGACGSCFSFLGDDLPFHLRILELLTFEWGGYFLSRVIRRVCGVGEGCVRQSLGKGRRGGGVYICCLTCFSVLFLTFLSLGVFAVLFEKWGLNNTRPLQSPSLCSNSARLLAGPEV